MLGISESHFWDSTPVELEPYRKMDKMIQERKDHDMWMLGFYVTNAVFVAVSKAFSGNKSRAEYMDAPLSRKIEKEKPNPKADFNKFCAWAAVYNATHIKKDNGQG